MPDDPVEILIVDDHPTFRMGVIAALSGSRGIGHVGEAPDTASAIVTLQQRPTISIALVDLHLEFEKGGACVAALLRRFPSLKVAILTAFPRDPEGYKALEAGAHGWLLKSSPVPQLLDAIAAIHRGESVITPEAAGPDPSADGAGQLTGREKEVLRLLVIGLVNKEIADRLDISLSTVKFHIQKVFDKLGVRDRTAAAVVAVREGVIPPGRPGPPR